MDMYANMTCGDIISSPNDLTGIKSTSICLGLGVFLSSKVCLSVGIVVCLGLVVSGFVSGMKRK